MHPVQILSNPPSPRSVFTDNVPRELHYGYIPAGNRSKYRDTLRRTMAAVPDPQTLVNDFINDAEAANPGLNWRREVFFRRVVHALGKPVQTTSLLATQSVCG